MPSYRFLSSSTMLCTLKVRRISPFVWCILSDIAVAWGFLEVIGFTIMPLSNFCLNLARNSFPLCMITVLGNGLRVNQANSTQLVTRSTRADGIVRISIQPVAGSITVAACK